MEPSTKLLRLAIVCIVVVIILAVLLLLIYGMDRQNHQNGYDVVQKINVTIFDINPIDGTILTNDEKQYYVSDGSSKLYEYDKDLDVQHRMSYYYYFKKSFIINHTYVCDSERSFSMSYVLSNCKDVTYA